MDRVRARTIFRDEKRSVTALESREFRTDRSNHGCLLIGSLKPIAVIVREPDRTYALDISAGPVDIKQLELPADLDLE